MENFNNLFTNAEQNQPNENKPQKTNKLDETKERLKAAAFQNKQKQEEVKSLLNQEKQPFKRSRPPQSTPTFSNEDVEAIAKGTTSDEEEDDRAFAAYIEKNEDGTPKSNKNPDQPNPTDPNNDSEKAQDFLKRKIEQRRQQPQPGPMSSQPALGTTMQYGNNEPDNSSQDVVERQGGYSQQIAANPPGATYNQFGGVNTPLALRTGVAVPNRPSNVSPFDNRQELNNSFERNPIRADEFELSTTGLKQLTDQQQYVPVDIPNTNYIPRDLRGNTDVSGKRLAFENAGPGPAITNPPIGNMLPTKVTPSRIKRAQDFNRQAIEQLKGDFTSV